MSRPGASERTAIRMLLLADQSPRHTALARRLAEVCHFSVEHVSLALNPGDLHRFSNVSMILASPGYLQRVNPHASLRLARLQRLHLLMAEDCLLESIEDSAWVDGFIFADGNLDHLCEAIALAGDGLTVIPPYIGPGFTPNDIRAPRIKELSRSERQVLSRLAHGGSNSQIAHELDLSEREVKYLVRAILSKLRFANRTEAAVFAWSYGDLLEKGQLHS